MANAALSQNANEAVPPHVQPECTLAHKSKLRSTNHHRQIHFHPLTQILNRHRISLKDDSNGGIIQHQHRGLGLKVSDILLPHPSLPNSLVLVPAPRDISHQEIYEDVAQPAERTEALSSNSGKTTTQSQPDLPPSASRKRPVPEPVAPQAPIKAGQGVSTKRTRKEPQAPSSNQEASNTDDTSSGEVKETDVVLVAQGYDLSSLLTFDPESIEPAASKASEESGPSATHGQLQQLKALLSSSIETLVEDTEGIKSILEDLQPHLPVTLQVKLWPVVTLSAYRSRVTLARQRIGLRHAQLPLKADIADKCQRLNEKKAALDAKTDTSVSTAELETLRKELEDLEERVRVTKQLIQDKEALIARSHEEAEGLKAELKTDLAEIRALKQAASDVKTR
ncbi:hypothetical protein QYE76_048401 [Lolium multiflorum]|uniref:Uncharacterized protein n=1 Tax=Lolium multiflorum TaxID=4521 RepID=A0AAD8SMJ9_LOLMU|nr:hypothetical protein QYE76_048401 [Lolium multiflorum]